MSNGASLLKKVHGPQSVAEVPKDARSFTYENNGDVTEMEVHVKAAGALYKQVLEADAPLWVMEKVKELITGKLAKGGTLCPIMPKRLKELVETIQLAKEGKDVEFPKWSNESQMFADAARTRPQENGGRPRENGGGSWDTGGRPRANGGS